MSISGFFKTAREMLKPALVTQHDYAVKALTMVAEGAHRRQVQRAPKRCLHHAPLIDVPEGLLVHRLPTRKGVAHTKTVQLKYQPTVDDSRYPFAHSYGGRHPGWLTRGAA